MRDTAYPYPPEKIGTTEIKLFPLDYGYLVGSWYIVKHGTDSDNSLFLHHDGEWYMNAGKDGAYPSKEEAQAHLKTTEENPQLKNHTPLVCGSILNSEAWECHSCRNKCEIIIHRPKNTGNKDFAEFENIGCILEGNDTQPNWKQKTWTPPSNTTTPSPTTTSKPPKPST